MRIWAGVLRVSDSRSTFVVCLLHFSGNGQGYLRHYRRPNPRFATDIEAAIEQCDPVTHAGEAHRLARTGIAPFFSSAETLPPISDLEPDDPVVAPDRHAHAIGSSVFARITERFLGYPEQVDFQRRGKAFLSQRAFVACLEALVLELLELHAYGGGQPKVVERGWPEVFDDGPCLLHRTPDELDGILKRFPVILSFRMTMLGEGLQAPVGGRRCLRETIVNLVGDPTTLFFLNRDSPSDHALKFALAFGKLVVEEM